MAASFLPMASSSASEPGLGDCTTQANDPHRTDKGILAKSTITCQVHKPDIAIWVLLYHCPDSVLGADGKPTLTMNWLLNNCDQRAGNLDQHVDVPANTKVTRQAPPVGSDLRLTQAGMWVNATNFTNNANGNYENRYAFRDIPPA